MSNYCGRVLPAGLVERQMGVPSVSTSCAAESAHFGISSVSVPVSFLQQAFCTWLPRAVDLFPILFWRLH